MFDHGFPSDWSTIKRLIWLKGVIAGGASAVWKTVTGTLIHLADALASPMQKCEVTLEPIQSGSGDPSPDNVRPITGWTGCNIYRSGADTSNPTTYPISWQTEAGTIYRGNVDIISGDITNECGKDSWNNNSSITLSETGTYCCRYKITSSKASYPPSPYTAEKAEALGFRCNMAKFVSSSTWDVDGQYGYYISNSGGTKNFFFICPKSFASTANELKAQLQTTPLEICYPLATRTTASIEGTEISTLAGENNIWADVNGEITIEYLAKG